MWLPIRKVPTSGSCGEGSLAPDVHLCCPFDAAKSISWMWQIPKTNEMRALTAGVIHIVPVFHILEFAAVKELQTWWEKCHPFSVLWTQYNLILASSAAGTLWGAYNTCLPNSNYLTNMNWCQIRSLPPHINITTVSNVKEEFCIYVWNIFSC